jgi:lipid A 4'-phosphatase
MRNDRTKKARLGNFQIRDNAAQTTPPAASMQPLLSTAPQPQTAPPLYWWLVCGFMALALIPTTWTALDLTAANLFMGPNPQSEEATWFWVVLINDYVPAVFRVCVLTALAAWVTLSVTRKAPNWRLPLAFVVLAGTLGPGVLVNNGFKDNWQRARPYQVQNFGGDKLFTRAAVMTDQCDANCSFVSGHVACGFFLASLMLVHRRRAAAWALTGCMAGLVIGFSRMADRAHWLSDVLWAGPITLLCSWVVWKFLLWAYRPRH